MSNSSGNAAKAPAAGLIFSVAVYAFPVGLILRGCKGTVSGSFSPKLLENFL